MIEKYHVMSSQGDLDYVISKEPDGAYVRYIMYRSDSDCWAEDLKGQELLNVYDTGDGYILGDKIKKNLNYEQMSQLFIMINFLNKDGSPLYEGSVIKIENIINI